jgi:hypothetical protein
MSALLSLSRWELASLLQLESASVEAELLLLLLLEWA